MQIKASKLYMKPKLVTAPNHNTMLILDCDCGVFYFDTPEARIVKIVVDPKKKLQLRACRMRMKFGNCWVEYRGPTDLMDHLSNMKIGLCWYQKGINNK